MSSLAESLNKFAAWATETQTAVKNVQAAVAPPKKVQTVEVQTGTVSVGEYAFDWRILAGTGAVLALLLIIKLTYSKG